MGILSVPIEEEIKLSYLDYALSVIIGRAIPDARDGLKPVQRRILYSMYENKLYPDRPFRKCATVVGDVIGKYHPHGDAAVYDALVRMAQDFKMRYPLITGQGNFGSIDGDPPAAYRYTEAKLSKLAMEMLKDIEENTVDFVPNFDGRLKEPVVLPAVVPNLLINGAEGIAVGVSTGIPPHNLGEIIDALIFLIDKPESSDEELLNIVKGPDFPTGGIILGTKGIKKMYLTGKGTITIRANYKIGERKGKPTLIFTEIPYGSNKAQIIKQISILVQDKIIEGIQDLRDETDKTGLRIVIELKKNTNVNKILYLLFKYTDLEKKYYANLLAIVGKKPKLLTLKEALQIYLKHREEVIKRRTQYRLEKALKRTHILEGLLKALNYLDKIISLIKISKDRKQAKERLIKEFKFTETQADAILDLRLYQLTRLERNTIIKEAQKLKKDIKFYKEVLTSKKTLYKIIKDELAQIKEKYADKRKTKIIEDYKEEKRILRENFLLFGASGNVYVGEDKAEFKIDLKENDKIVEGFKIKEKETLFILTSRGRILKINASQIMPHISRKKKKEKIFIKLKDNENVVSVLKEKDKKDYFLIITTNGKGKRIKISDIEKAKSGSSFINLSKKQGEKVFGGIFVSEDDLVIISKNSGKILITDASKIPILKKSSKGIDLISISENEKLTGITTLNISLKPLAISENAYAKILDLQEFKPTRGTGGSIFFKIDETTGEFLGIKWIKEHFYLVSEDKKVKRFDIKEIPAQSRMSKGKKIWDKKIIGIIE